MLRIFAVRIIADSNLKAFSAKHPDAEASLERWVEVMSGATFNTPAEVAAVFSSSKVVSQDRVRFEVAGGCCRLIVAFKFRSQIAFVKFIGTHAECDDVDAATISQF